MEKLKQWFSTLTPKQKKSYVLIAALLGIVLMWAISKVVVKPTERIQRVGKPQQDLLAKDRGDADLEKLAASMREIRTLVTNIDQRSQNQEKRQVDLEATISQYKAIREDPKVMKSLVEQMNAINQDNKLLRDYMLRSGVGDTSGIKGVGGQGVTLSFGDRPDLTNLKQDGSSADSASSGGVSNVSSTATTPASGADPKNSGAGPFDAKSTKSPSMEGALRKAQNQPEGSDEEGEPADEIRMVGVGSSVEGDGKSSGKGKTAGAANSISRDRHGRQVKEEAGVYIPSGTILTGALVTGLDAPTASTASANPTPVLVRLNMEGILPNRAAIDVRECFMLAGGYGDLSSERAKFRAESLSCVLPNGDVIDVRISAYATGEDGKEGMRGRLVSKQGQLIANALLAGLAGGIGQGMSPQQKQSIQTGGQGGNIEFQAPNFADVAQIGVMKGASTGAQEISKFYLEQAKSIFPVIEIDAMRPVSFIVTKGLTLKKTPGPASTRG